MSLQHELPHDPQSSFWHRASSHAVAAAARAKRSPATYFIVNERERKDEGIVGGREWRMVCTTPLHTAVIDKEQLVNKEADRRCATRWTPYQHSCNTRARERDDEF
mmetsp:Transcript_18273/g.42702  ORF Transcript_18273/g.42702 Transcript_18273/m.42702 type:complete len:106 (+) Transcript_18273:442-759(+)